MPPPIYSQQDFASAFLNLLPQGRVWPRDPDSVMADFWYAMAGTYQRQANSAAAISLDSPPFSLNEMLPDWESALGLPDDCITTPQSFAQRVQSVQAKLSSVGGQSAAYFIGIAASLGYSNATVTNFAPFRAGRSSCGDPLGDSGWFFVWELYVPSLPVSYFSCGINACGDPLYSLQGNALECTIERYAPAHTVVQFAGYDG